MPYWQCRDVFGPGRGMHRPVLRWRKWPLRKRYRRGRGDLPYNRPKWTWWPRHVLNRRPPLRVSISNAHWMRQTDRCVALIRPPHLRKPKCR